MPADAGNAAELGVQLGRPSGEGGPWRGEVVEVGKDAEVPRAVQKLQDGRSRGDASGWDSPPESLSLNWTRRGESQGLFILPKLLQRRKGQELLRLSLSIFCPFFPEKSSLNTDLLPFRSHGAG